MTQNKSLLIAEAKQDFWLNYAIREIESTYGHTVYPKSKSLLKFGQSDTIGTTYDLVWNVGGNEIDPTTNSITHFSSSSASDTQVFVVEGHTLDGSGNKTFVTQHATMNGQTKTALTTPIGRCSRMYNNGTVSNVGDIYVYEDDTVSSGVPQTANKIHMKVAAGDNQSFKAKTSLASTDYLIVTGGYGSIREKTTTVADFRFESKVNGSIYRPIMTLSTNGPPIVFNFKPYGIIPANADVQVRAEASSINTSVDAGFQGVICAIR